jgi:spermidine/putrescine transport system permease protein
MNFIRAIFSRIALPAFVLGLFFFVYLPIFILVVFSFNKVDFPYEWVGFSLKWYKELVTSPEIWHVFKNSLIVAFSSVVLSLSMALFLIYYSSQSNLRRLLPIFYANLLFPEIVLAVGLLSLFTFFFIPLGIPSLIAGHTLLGLGYAVPILAASFAKIDKSIIEASLDLGATINQTFYKVIIPALLPSIIAAGLLVFIISFDDFLLAFFCAGPETQTLPLYIFAMIRSGVSPTINALSTLLILLSGILVLIFFSLKSKIRIF